MQNEMLPLPQGTAIIPTEYTIFLSDEDDKEWQGAKRRGLEQGLYHILAERAREIAGKKKLETRSFVIELRIDGTLEKGEVRVQHSWEDTSSNKTGVLARPKPVADEPPTVRQVPKTDEPPPTIKDIPRATGQQPIRRLHIRRRWVLQDRVCRALTNRERCRLNSSISLRFAQARARY